ncbi:MAG: FAD-dependent oxidoreductase [Hyphomicrobiales bacterium]|nr:FAD-dependent oxidoreductase [Hyphomicrobiales bacterium]
MKTAQIVIIGGGIMGCSLAYHLCKEGMRDVLLLEKASLTSGSTWHAAGQITHSVSHYGLAKMAAYGTELYARLESETGQSVSWHGCGSLRVAYSRDEEDWLRYTLSVGRGLGHEMEIIGPEDIAKLHPFYQLDGIRAALHTPADGHVDPAGATNALALGAREMGARISQQNRATGLSRDNDGWVVRSEEGDIRAGIVVNAAGCYARQVAQWAGLDIPVANLLHHYLVTDPVDEFAALERELPVVRDDSQVSGYIRMEQQSGLVGIYEKQNAATVWDNGAPWDAESELFEPDIERISPWLENAMARMPVLENYGIRRIVHGAITHPPDGNMMLGPSGVRGFWMCCGASVGIAWGAGAGKYLAQWIAHGAADIAMNSFDPRRFGANIDDTYRIDKAKEDYLLRHEIPFPHLDRPACRPSHSKCSPLYEKLKGEGAVYADVYGWERPLWYATGGIPREHIYGFRRTQLHDVIGREVNAVRQGAGIADLTAFAKVEIHGGGAAAFLERVSSNRLPNVGKIALTYFVNANGRLEGEATCARLSDTRFYLVYAAAREAAVLDWLQTQLLEGEDVAFENVSNRYGILMLAGPNARDVLASAGATFLGNDDFPWLSLRHGEVAGVANVRLMRVGYSGELGWELHIPIKDMPQIHAALVKDGAAFGLAHVGMAALNAMRMEKAYRSGAEITNEVTLAEADVPRFARNGGFQGAEASLAKPSKWQLALLRLEEPAGGIAADPLGSESVWKDSDTIGAIASGGYGYNIGAYLAWAYLRPSCVRAGERVEVMVMGEMRGAEVFVGVPFDPDNQRAKA